MEIKHFILERHAKWCYDKSGYISYVSENIEDIKALCNEYAHDRIDIEDINMMFYSTDMLFTSFLKWCLSN